MSIGFAIFSPSAKECVINKILNFYLIFNIINGNCNKKVTKKKNIFLCKIISVGLLWEMFHCTEGKTVSLFWDKVKLKEI